MSGYKDPSKEVLSNGMSVSSVVRGSKDMKGVIVAPAGVDGKSTAFDPHDKSTISINVEPDSGNSQKLALSQFTKEAVSSALKRAEERIPGNDIDSIRERTAVAFEELSRIANSGVVKRAAAPVAAVPPAIPPRPPSGSPPAAEEPPEEERQPPTPESVDRGYSPMAAFGLKRSRTKPTAPAAAAKPARDSGPPTKLLYFEKEGIGTVPAFFHDVVIDVEFDNSSMTETGFIVLIYDLQYDQAAARWFPPANDPYQRPWALQINNDRRLYLVQTTGFQYVYDNREFCVLSVEKAVTAEI